jgi:hypothetical protein
MGVSALGDLSVKTAANICERRIECVMSFAFVVFSEWQSLLHTLTIHQGKTGGKNPRRAVPAQKRPPR